jgi:adenylate cyclase
VQCVMGGDVHLRVLCRCRCEEHMWNLLTIGRSRLHWLIQAHPTELHRTVWFQEEARAERITSLIRVLYTLIWLSATIPAIPMHPFSANVANVGLGTIWFIFAVIHHLYLLARPYHLSLKYFSITTDVLITTGILFLYHYDMGQATTFKAPPFINYLLALALAGFRFNITLPVFGGVLSIICYTLIVFYFYFFEGIIFGSVIDFFTTSKINALYLFYQVTYIITFTIVIVVSVQNIHHLVNKHITESKRALAERYEREKTMITLERYFSPELAKYLLERPQNLGGNTAQVVVLISDIRGFTTLSERLGPVKTVDLLNELFTQLVQIVFKYGGTLDKFLGDGMLVIFGFPEPHREDAINAVSAALEMVETTRIMFHEYNLQLGVAIHCGEAIVGNVGSPARMEFTVIGDVVNTTARLEALNKEFQSNILISEPVYQMVDSVIVAHELDMQRLRGKATSLKVFEVVSLTNTRT